MNGKIICEKCGTVMLPIDKEKPVGMVCPNCGWGWATTYGESIYEDATTYSLTVLSAPTNNEVLKTIAEIATCNYIRAKELLSKAPFVIKEGSAADIKKCRDLLEQHNVQYEINPSFPY